MKKIFLYGREESLSNYTQALLACNAQPVVSKNIELIKDCAALLLPGGDDIDPQLYGAPLNGSRKIDRKRDLAELALTKSALALGLPILGICKGIQIINVAFGGDLIQDLPTAETHQWTAETGDQVHSVTAEKGSFLEALYGTTFMVNSAHHQGIGKIALPFSLSAKAPDGVVESIAWEDKKIYGVQWHPERMAFSHRRRDTVDGEKLLRFFLSL